MRKSILIFLLSICCCISSASRSDASPVAIGDPSFEGISLAPGGFTSGVYAANSWSSDANSGIFFPSAASFPAGAPDGLNVGYSNSGSVIDQVLSSTLTANTIYTLSAYVGDRLDGPHNTGYTIQLLAGGVVLNGTTNFPTPPTGSFVVATDTFTASAADPHLGQPLEIKLFSAASGQTDFDLVKLDASTVPEPSTIALLTLGGLCLLARRRPRS